MENGTLNHNIPALQNPNAEHKTVTVQFECFLGKSAKEVTWTIGLTREEAIEFAQRTGDISAGPILQMASEVRK